eukprot:TRINITY_DN9472_c0_g1_i6.p1 TRINITY_DN9472_c0_g1~~TRINITY_DN9472_c0_g1_i6.p1  ORF type:complete len:291 (+),score=19.39 TRINITY_DN9472_c0_g1_i6:60-875(+)
MCIRDRSYTAPKLSIVFRNRQLEVIHQLQDLTNARYSKALMNSQEDLRLLTHFLLTHSEAIAGISSVTKEQDCKSPYLYYGGWEFKRLALPHRDKFGNYKLEIVQSPGAHETKWRAAYVKGLFILTSDRSFHGYVASILKESNRKVIRKLWINGTSGEVKYFGDFFFIERLTTSLKLVSAVNGRIRQSVINQVGYITKNVWKIDKLKYLIHLESLNDNNVYVALWDSQAKKVTDFFGKSVDYVSLKEFNNIDSIHRVLLYLPSQTLKGLFP